MYSRVELITPEMATMYLEKNTHNRKVKQEAVRRYANDMKNGNWQLNNQGIAFHKDGSLADGQHRLLAIVLSKTAVEMLVTYDVPDETTLFDRGVIRYGKTVLGAADLDTGYINTISAVSRDGNVGSSRQRGAVHGQAEDINSIVSIATAPGRIRMGPCQRRIDLGAVLDLLA